MNLNNRIAKTGTSLFRLRRRLLNSGHVAWITCNTRESRLLQIVRLCLETVGENLKAPCALETAQSLYLTKRQTTLKRRRLCNCVQTVVYKSDGSQINDTSKLDNS